MATATAAAAGNRLEAQHIVAWRSGKEAREREGKRRRDRDRNTGRDRH